MAKLNGVTAIDGDRIAYGDGGYEKVTGPAQVGDIVRVESGKFSDVGKGEYFQAVRGFDMDVISIYDNAGDFRWGTLSEGNDWTVFRRTVAKPIPSVQYREVRRKAEVGERIRIVNGFMTSGMYKNGNEFTVNKSHAPSNGMPHVYVDGTSAVILDTEYVVLEPVETEPDATPDLAAEIAELERQLAEKKARLEAEQADSERFNVKVGDTVRITRYHAGHSVGTVGVVTQIITGNQQDPSTKFNNVRVCANGETFYEVDVELVQAALQPKFNVGDYAKTLVAFDVPRGEFVKITEVSGHQYRGVMLNGSEFDWYFASQLEPVSAETVQKAEDERKWSAIGRKVGEYKKGDIVRVVESTGFVPVGVIGTVGERDEWDGSFRVNTAKHMSGNFHRDKHVELITPVEQRFDR